MANHKSSIKRIRSNDAKRLRNRYQAKSTRTSLKVIRELTDKKEAVTMLPEVTAMLDKLVKKNIIHKNKAANLKSKLAKKVNNLGKVEKAEKAPKAAKATKTTKTAKAPKAEKAAK
jgi:small subunit ribosomal protein S20